MGPQCSGKSAPSPASTLILRLAEVAGSWAWIAEPIVDAPEESRLIRPEDAAVWPTSAPTSIFHPPRRPA